MTSRFVRCLPLSALRTEGTVEGGVCVTFAERLKAVSGCSYSFCCTQCSALGTRHGSLLPLHARSLRLPTRHRERARPVHDDMSAIVVACSGKQVNLWLRCSAVRHSLFPWTLSRVLCAAVSSVPLVQYPIVVLFYSITHSDSKFKLQHRSAGDDTGCMCRWMCLMSPKCHFAMHVTRGFTFHGSSVEGS